MKKLALVVLAALMPAAYAADKPCPPAEAARAEKSVDTVVTWAHLHKAWKDWKHCDSGAVADVYTDAILRLMVEWKNVDALGEGMKDPEYKSFIQAHLRSPAAKDDRGSIMSRVSQSCPKGHGALCKDIEAGLLDEAPKPAPAPAPAAAPAATPAPK
ncbi:MAG TPA: hypothetical protein VM051_14140 [Usitatibacter sp.]|nr:hypothetical protein [Usitatibacter sp.]